MELIHTCYRITDPERSLAFYEALGFEKRRELPIREEAVNYFLGIPGHEQPERLLRARDRVRTHRGHCRRHGGGAVGSGVEGIEPERPPCSVREGGSLIAFVRDPDGNRLVAN